MNTKTPFSFILTKALMHIQLVHYPLATRLSILMPCAPVLGDAGFHNSLPPFIRELVSVSQDSHGFTVSLVTLSTLKQLWCTAQPCREFMAWVTQISNACLPQFFQSMPGPSLDVRKFLSGSWAVPTRLVLEAEILLLNFSQTALQSAV